MLRVVSRSSHLCQLRRLLWLWEMRKGKYYGQILKWLQAGSSSEDARARLANLPHGQRRGARGGVGWTRSCVVLCHSDGLITDSLFL